jgi:DNA invertase Pin-like site-specific DNA recombinase
MAVAYSYLRFSSPQQATGDSLRRQTQNREVWLATHPGTELDRSLVMTDAGRSAFQRKNWDTYALARFVECIKSGRVEKGSYLLVENLDRLSREDAGEATELFLSIVNKGIVVVQLSPVVMEFRRPVNMHSLMFAIMELSRGHSESAIKSERGRASWAKKQGEAATRVVTRKLPGWIRFDEQKGKLVLDPERAKVVRRVFGLARDGYGVTAISAKLNAEGVPVMGRAVVKGRKVAWSGSLVYYMLQTRAVLGEYVPYKGRTGGTPVAEPVPNYFPPVIDADTFHAVQAAMARRARVGRGRRGTHVNLFAGLLIDARDDGTLSYWHTRVNPPTLISINAKERRGVGWVSFPAWPFEEAILSKLVEVRASDIQGGDDGRKKLEVLTGQLAEIDSLTKLWMAKMDDPAIVDTVATKLTELSTKRRAVATELEAARREAASPVSEAWGEFRGLSDLLRKDNSDELRMKVRAALRRSIEEVTCLFVKRGRIRLAAVRVQFAGGDIHRDYLIAHRVATFNGVVRREPQTWVLSFREASRGPLDLRQPKDAAKLQRELERMDLSAVTNSPTRTRDAR